MKCQIALLVVSLMTLTTKAAENAVLQNQARQAEEAELAARQQPEPQSEPEPRPDSGPRPGPVVAEGAVGTLARSASDVRPPALELPPQQTVAWEHAYPGLREGGYASPRNIQGNPNPSDPRNQRSWSDVFRGGDRGGASASRASEPAAPCRGRQCLNSLRRSPAEPAEQPDEPEPHPEPLGPDRWEDHYPGLRNGGFHSPRDIRGNLLMNDPRNNPEWLNQHPQTRESQ